MAAPRFHRGITFGPCWRPGLTTWGRSFPRGGHSRTRGADLPPHSLTLPLSDYEIFKIKEEVPSLLDESGNFYNDERTSEMLERAKLDELEVEFRAQVEAVLAAALAPTHVDWHCVHSGGRADIFDLTMGLAKEYGLALRVASHPYIDQVQSQGLP